MLYKFLKAICLDKLVHPWNIRIFPFTIIFQESHCFDSIILYMELYWKSAEPLGTICFNVWRVLHTVVWAVIHFPQSM